MVASVAHDETLAEFLGVLARRTRPERLVLGVVGGFLVGVVSFWARPTGWVALAAAGLCVASYGGWALIERRFASMEHDASADVAAHLEIAHQALGVFGLASFAAMLFALLGIALGPINS